MQVTFSAVFGFWTLRWPLTCNRCLTRVFCFLVYVSWCCCSWLKKMGWESGGAAPQKHVNFWNKSKICFFFYFWNISKISNIWICENISKMQIKKTKFCGKFELRGPGARRRRYSGRGTRGRRYTSVLNFHNSRFCRKIEIAGGEPGGGAIRQF